jgi:Fic family protein
MMTGRAGSYIKQPSGYLAFIPSALPPEPPLNFDSELIRLLAEANRELGRLDGAAEILPNPDLFVAMYVKKEAVLSLQIEGTQASLVDVLEFGADKNQAAIPEDVGEVINYVKAMNYGLGRLDTLPLSLRLIREIHAVLLENTRGWQRNPGEFRQTQNWLGPSGCNLKTATFIPPPVPDMINAMNDLEMFLHNASELPILIKAGLAHCQFETIHPFLDGNGRIGRLLITFMLCQQGALSRPLLYLSYYFKKNRPEYYDWLMEVRNNGDWEGWLKFFLKGVIEVSKQAISTARKIIEMQYNHKALVSQEVKTPNALKLLDLLYLRPILSVSDVKEGLGISYPTANNLVNRFTGMDILRERTGQQRHKVFNYTEYLEILNDTV